MKINDIIGESNIPRKPLQVTVTDRKPKPGVTPPPVKGSGSSSFNPPAEPKQANTSANTAVIPAKDAGDTDPNNPPWFPNDPNRKVPSATDIPNDYDGAEYTGDDDEGLNNVGDYIVPGLGAIKGAQLGLKGLQAIGKKLLRRQTKKKDAPDIPTSAPSVPKTTSRTSKKSKSRDRGTDIGREYGSSSSEYQSRSDKAADWYRRGQGGPTNLSRKRR